MRGLFIHTLVALLVFSAAVPTVRAQNAAPQNDAPQIDAPQNDAPPVDVDTPPVVSVLEDAKVDAIVELLVTSYAAALAMHVAVRGSECTADQPRCAPLFFAQDVILAPWNFIQLLKMTNEQPDPDPTVVPRRSYRIHEPRSAGVLPPEMVSLADYAIEQQVGLYSHLEAWRISLDRYRSAVVRNDEPAVVAQRGAIETYSADAATAAAAAGAASMQFLENLTPLMRHFAFAISAEDEQTARDDLRDNGFGPDLQAWFSVFRIGAADRDMLRDEIFAIVGDAPVDLMDCLTAVAQGYDRIADVMSVSADGTSNLRPVAQAGPDQTVPSSNGDRAMVMLAGSGSTDPEAGPLQYAWTAGDLTATGVRPTLTLPIGIHHIALTVTDAKGGTDVDLVTVTVANSAAPIIAAVVATPDVLSPVSRQLVPVELSVKVTDNDDPEPFCQVVSVGVNEGAADRDATATEPDVVLDGTLKVLLRAERSSGKTNRVYSVTVQCTDKTSHSSAETVFVSVPP